MGKGSGGDGAGGFLHRSRPYSRSRDGAFAADSKTGAERSCLQSACYGLALMLVIGTVAVGIAALVLWLVFRPRVPEFNLQDVQVHSVEVDPVLPGYSSFKVHLSMNSTFVLAVSNRNKVVIRFDPVSLHVLYKDLLLGVAVIPAFHLSARRNTTVRSQFLVESLNVVQAAALNLLGDSLDDHIPLQITGDVPARVRILGLVTPHMKVQVRCVIVLKPHEMTLDSKECGR